MGMKLANNAEGTLSLGISDTDTQITLSSGEGNRFPSLSAGDWCPLTVVRDSDPRQLEIMKVTAVNSDTLTVERSQEGTGPLSFDAGDIAALRVTAGILTEFLVPPKTIFMFQGTPSDVPSGYALCDGSNGTPPLADKFVVATGGTYNLGDTGGANQKTTSKNGGHDHGAATGSAGSHTHSGNTSTNGSHNHGGTNATTLSISQMPSHNHSYDSPQDFDGNGDITDSADRSFVSRNTSSTGGSGSHSHSISNDGAHNHSLNINSNGAHAHTISAVADHSHTVDVRPPYYALAFIMKL